MSANRVAIVACLLCAGSAGAHDYWLVPETFTPKDRAVVPVRLFVGEEFKPEQEIASAAKKVLKVTLATGTTTPTDVAAQKDGAKPAFAFTMRGTGTAVLRVDRDWASIVLKGDKFTAYLKEEGLDEIVKLRAAAGESNEDGKERYRRCLKTIVHGGGKPDDTPTRPTGQMFEIVPDRNPYALKAGDRLGVTVLFDGKPLAGAKLAAHHRTGDELTTTTATTDNRGKAAFKLTKSGPWIVRAVTMRRVVKMGPVPPADWESFWSSVTFELP